MEVKDFESLAVHFDHIAEATEQSFDKRNKFEAFPESDIGRVSGEV